MMHLIANSPGTCKDDYRNDPLWQRIEALSLDDAEATFPFSTKLAKENKWTPHFAGLAIAEYKRFVYLCCIGPHGASPAPVIDEVWHLHLTYTRHYWEELCEKTIGRKLHHHPSKGGVGEQLKHKAWYQDTLDLYLKTFGAIPPPLFWPESGCGVLTKKWFKWPSVVVRPPVTGALALMMIMLLSGCSFIEIGFLTVVFVVFIMTLFSIGSDGTSSSPRNRSTSSHDCSGGNSGCGGGGCGGGGCGGGCGG